MTKETLRDAIVRISREHILQNNGIIMGQCLSTDGRVRGTVPEIENEQGILEVSMADVAGGLMAVGAALVEGRRPIYISRFQGFQWFNGIGLANYAAKSKEMWGVPCPVFTRAISLDGSGGFAIGPVAGNSHHSIVYRMPGIDIAAPMTPKEYEEVWAHFMSHDDPIYVSEHRKGWDVDYEMKPILTEDADITLLPISSTRLNVRGALSKLEEHGIKCNIVDLLWLKPFNLNNKGAIERAFKKSKYGGLVIDGDHEGGVAKNIAYDLMCKHGKRVHVLALEDRTAGFAPWNDNYAPSADKICDRVKYICREL